VNPLATILSGAMMLHHLHIEEAAREVESAVAAVLADGKIRTPTWEVAAAPKEVTDAVLEKLA
jgi:isocitrate/isopropylmalate dehydrogenase